MINIRDIEEYLTYLLLISIRDHIGQIETNRSFQENRTPLEAIFNVIKGLKLLNPSWKLKIHRVRSPLTTNTKEE
jgi:hypothetical protein